MGMLELFRPKPKKTEPQFPPERYEPVLRCSICTGEQTACMRSKETGKLTELMLVRGEEDLAAFRETYHLGPGEIEKVW